MTNKASYEQVAKLSAKWRRQSQRIVFTNGVFDLLHLGHAHYLAEARRKGEKLIVGVNADASVRRLNKGPERPIHNEADRKALLEHLQSVDIAVVFHEDTPLRLIEALRPDVLVKGGDYDAACTDPTNPAYMVGSAEVRSWGGVVVAIPLVEGHSTTGIVKKLGA